MSFRRSLDAFGLHPQCGFWIYFGICTCSRCHYWYQCIIFYGDFAETAFSLRQTDIAGFYNQVEHDRILLAIQFAVFTFASQCEQGLDTVMQSHVVRLERMLRVFSRILERKDETIYDYYFA